MVVQNVRHMGFVVSDLERCKEIFSDVFGLKIWTDYLHPDMDYIRKLVGTKSSYVKICVFQMPDGGKIELLEYEHKVKNSSTSDSVGINHVSLTIDDIDEIFKKFNNGSLLFVHEPIINPEQTVKLAYAKVCDDFFVELVEEL